LLLVALLAAPGPRPLRADAARRTTVGMPDRVEQLILPGPELEAKPREDRKTPIVVRVVEVYPHGSAFRYDLVYYGLEPGTFDLRDFLRRKDGSSTAGLPAIPVTIRPVLPPGQVEPNRLEPRPTRGSGGYRLVLLGIAVAWVAGLAAILVVGRRRRRVEAVDGAGRPESLADRLRPLVEEARAGTLGPDRRAELERLLIGYWRRRLGLERADPAEAIARLRRHDEAGPLLGQLDAWLHRPGPADAVDVAALLKPYQDLPADAPEGAPTLEGRPA
jgi:hypothetical protein